MNGPKTTHSPLQLHAGPEAGFDEPFEMLVACHGRVRRMLDRLERLGAYLDDRGCDAVAGNAAREVMRYFDLAGPAHHEDEERHLFPALDARGDPALSALVARLRAEHVEMAQRWAGLRARLASVADGTWTPEDAAGAHADRAGFAALYREHIGAEEAVAYPAAEALFDLDARAAMGREMARRRGAA